MLEGRPLCFADKATYDALVASPDDYDVVVVDQTMPRLTGLEFTRKMRASGLGHAVILMSGDITPFSPEVLDEIDAEVLGKPFPMEHLIDRVRVAQGG